MPYHKISVSVDLALVCLANLVTSELRYLSMTCSFECSQASRDDHHEKGGGEEETDTAALLGT